ncbi:hypothetical protein BKA69DRAFT_1125204 [Paraphysoderma sedebokerense]|nr:hypothetical protein BKA69DRAFT_1125204 [Paraphysoderma sedebokerense]
MAETSNPPVLPVLSTYTTDSTRTLRHRISSSFMDITAALSSPSLSHRGSNYFHIFQEITATPSPQQPKSIGDVVRIIRLHTPTSLEDLKRLNHEELDALLSDLGVSEPVRLKIVDGKNHIISIANGCIQYADVKYRHLKDTVTGNVSQVRGVLSDNASYIKLTANEHIDHIKPIVTSQIDRVRETVNNTVDASPSLSAVACTAQKLSHTLAETKSQPISQTVSSISNYVSTTVTQHTHLSSLSDLHTQLLSTFKTTASKMNESSQSVVTIVMNKVSVAKKSAMDVYVAPVLTFLDESYSIVQHPTETVSKLALPITKLIIHSTDTDNDNTETDEQGVIHNPVVTYLVNMAREMNKQVAGTMFEPVVEYVRDSKVGDVVFLVVGNSEKNSNQTSSQGDQVIEE